MIGRRSSNLNQRIKQGLIGLEAKIKLLKVQNYDRVQGILQTRFSYSVANSSGFQMEIFYTHQSFTNSPTYNQNQPSSLASCKR